MLSKALLFAAALACCLAVVSCQGSSTCPDDSICVEDFDLSQFLGVWYEISTSPTSRLTFEHNCTCTYATYSLNDDGTIEVVNRCNHGDAEGQLITFNGTAIANPDLPSEIEVSFGGPYGPYWVILNDEYEAICVWSCTELDGFAFPYMWILARTSSIDADLYASLTAKAEELTGWDTSKLIPTDQDGCSYATTAATEQQWL